VLDLSSTPAPTFSSVCRAAVGTAGTLETTPCEKEGDNHVNFGESDVDAE
jgi:hypothetical protein